ncbi:MAG: hypothetical protein JSV27_10450 [Candidatus Bathyarchaeota archaeon]|nr:MAG: hypothetical protein JSV27_10450 [Candidatus Bathyarchaeota archaeon]
MKEKDWRTALSYKLSLGVVALTLIVSLIDLLHPPIFLKETASAKAQVIGQDLVNLALGIPALIASMDRSRRGSYKARMIWLGLLAYFAYTFLSYAVLFKLNPGFLAYTAAFGLSLYATLLNLSGMDVDRLDVDVTPSVRKWTPYSMMLILIIIAILWSPDVTTYYTAGTIPPSITVDGAHTLIIPFQDYAIVLPLTLLTAWLAYRGETLGFILAPVVLVKALSIALAVLGMIVAMQYYGTPAILGQVIVFVIGSLIVGAYTRHYLSGIEIRESL